jgi:hypothetical protein
MSKAGAGQYFTHEALGWLLAELVGRFRATGGWALCVGVGKVRGGRRESLAQAFIPGVQ